MTGEIREVDEFQPKVIPTDQAQSLGWSRDYREFSPARKTAEQAQQ